MAKTKIAFIGPAAIHDAFATMDENWDFQEPIESLAELQEALSGAPDAKVHVAEDTSIIIFFSRLFEGENRNVFAKYAATVAPLTATMVLIPNDDGEEGRAEITAAIKATQADMAEDPEEAYNPETPFYFVSYENPQADISEALTAYVRDDLANDDARTSILQSLPDSLRESLQQQAYDDEEFQEINGNDDYYDYSDDDRPLPEASPDATGKVITVTSSKGGSGKSTVSLLLATYLAKGSIIAAQENKLDKPFSVCVVDFDTRDGQLGFLNGAQDPSIVDILSAGGNNPSQDDIREGIWHNKNMGVDFIFSTKRPRHADKINPSFYGHLVQRLKEMYDYVILDTSVNYLDPLLGKVAYPVADSIVFVSDVGISSIFGMMRWIRETTQAEDLDDDMVNISPTKIGIVVNKVLGDVNMSVDKIERAASGLPIYALLPSMPGLITYAANTSSMDQVLNQPIINHAIYQLAEELVEKDGHVLGEVPSLNR